MSVKSSRFKYEVVFGIPDDEFKNSRYEKNEEKYIDKWQEFAKEYYIETGVYVSAIANFGKAVYNLEWGCPLHGERTITFNCTANPAFINANDIKIYENGISNKLKKYFKQNTVTITKMYADVFYIDNNEGENDNE